MKWLTRREFLNRLSLVSAGLLGAGGATRTASGDVRAKGKPADGPNTIDPKPGALFKDPLEITNTSVTPGIVEVVLEAKPAWVNVNGVLANLLTYNGSYPAPTIRAKQGDLLKIHFKNSLPPMGVNALGFDREVTNLHTHGLHVSPGLASDNALLMLMSGNSFDYEFDLSRQQPGTLSLYHPLSPGTSAEQVWGGLAGALVIADENSDLSAFETHILVLKDITMRAAAPEPYASPLEYVSGKEGDTVTVNGQVNPVLQIRPGQVQRWRIVNASNARFYNLELERHALHIIGTDGGLLDKPYPVPSLLLAPGERLDVLVKADQPVKNSRFLSRPYDRGVGDTGDRVTLMTLSYAGTPVRDVLPSSINPLARRLIAPQVKTTQILLSMEQGKGFLNNISSSGLDSYTQESVPGTIEVWELANQSSMDQPFHLQVNAFQVLSIQGGDAAYASFLARTPSLKDTVIVPRRGIVKIMLQVRDFEGTAVFHGAILEHLDIGMMGLWDISAAADEEQDALVTDFP